MVRFSLADIRRAPQLAASFIGCLFSDKPRNSQMVVRAGRLLDLRRLRATHYFSLVPPSDSDEHTAAGIAPVNAVAKSIYGWPM